MIHFQDFFYQNIFNMSNTGKHSQYRFKWISAYLPSLAKMLQYQWQQTEVDIWGSKIWKVLYITDLCHSDKATFINYFRSANVDLSPDIAQVAHDEKWLIDLISFALYWKVQEMIIFIFQVVFFTKSSDTKLLSVI